MSISKDFPKSLIEFVDRFGTEGACRDYLVRLKWPDGYVCPRSNAESGAPCGCTTYWTHEKKDLWICTKCGHQTSLRVGTVFEHSKKPLRTWFFALFHVSNSKQGISALELQRLMGFGSYKTAWTWLHKLRRFMEPTKDGDDARLAADVEVDDLTFGGVYEGGKQGRGSENKIKVFIAVERRGRRCGRVRFRVVPAHDASSVRDFVKDWVETGAMLYTDGSRIFHSLPSLGYGLHAVTTNDSGIAIRGRQGKKLAELHLPKAHRVISKVKLLVGGTHQNSYTGKHLERYLGEYAYRFDRRDSRVPGLMFQELVARLVGVVPPRYWQIVGRKDYRTPLAARTEVPFWSAIRKVLVSELGLA